MYCKVCQEAVGGLEAIMILVPLGMTIEQNVGRPAFNVVVETSSELLTAFHRDCFNDCAGKDFNPWNNR